MKDDKAKPVTPPQAKDVVDGIPDRSSRRSAWKYLLLAALFLAWIAFLVYVLQAGR